MIDLKIRAQEFGGQFHKTIFGDSWFAFTDKVWANRFAEICKARNLDVEVQPNRVSVTTVSLGIPQYWVVIFEAVNAER